MRFPLSRRTFVATIAASAARAAAGEAVPTNPLGARAYIFTVVTPDLDASIRFYCDLMGYVVHAAGTISRHAPRIAGAAVAGRSYALVRTAQAPNADQGFIRLIEAPRGAKAIRPRPGATILDPGLAVYECMARDVDESYERLSRAGVPVISAPQHYFFRDMKPLPGARKEADFDIRSMSAFGPAGEQMFISTMVQVPGMPEWQKPFTAAAHGPMTAAVTITQDRWPVLDFYRAAFGILPTRDTYCGQETVNLLMGAPRGTYFQFGMLGETFGMEWWEYRQQHPAAQPPFPTSLDRTGLAMTTISVPQLEEVEQRFVSAGIKPLGQAELPTPRGMRSGLVLRGAVGELIEVLGET
jgi:catechol 2,3-dioxygenase-like lactoylglutathione lyase family enzyme